MTRGPGAPPPTEPRDPALDLLRDLGPKATLTAAAKRRISSALQDPSPAAPRAWLLVFPALAAIAVAVYWLGRPQPSARAPLVASQQLVVPVCGISRITNETLHYRGSFVGPAAATVEADGSITLRSGRAVVTTGANRASVATASAHIAIEPRSLVEIVVRDYQPLHVATFTGRAQIEVSSQPTIVVDAGASWVDGVLQAGTPAQAREARQIADEDASMLQLCPAALPSKEAQSVASTPSPRPEPPEAIVPRRARPETVAPPPPSIDVPAPEVQTAALPPPVPAPPADATVLGEAIHQLRQGHDPRAAIALLDQLDRTHPGGEFAQERTLIRVEALRHLGDDEKTLALLDGLSLADLPRGDELTLLRAELRRQLGRYREAANDYSALIARAGSSEKALVGRADCRFKLGDEAGARLDLAAYLKAYPTGQYAADARRVLGSP